MTKHSPNKPTHSPMEQEEIKAIALALNHGQLDGMVANLSTLLHISDSAICQWINGKTKPAAHTTRLMRMMFHLYSEQNVNRKGSVFADALMMSLRPVIRSKPSEEGEDEKTHTRRHRASEFIATQNLEARVERARNQYALASKAETFGLIFNTPGTSREEQKAGIEAKIEPRDYLEVGPGLGALLEAVKSLPDYSVVVIEDKNLMTAAFDEANDTADAARRQITEINVRATLSQKHIDVHFVRSSDSWGWNPYLGPALNAIGMPADEMQNPESPPATSTPDEEETTSLENKDKMDNIILLSDNRPSEEPIEFPNGRIWIFNSDRPDDEIAAITEPAARIIKKSGLDPQECFLARQAKEEDCPHNPSHAITWEQAIEASAQHITANAMTPISTSEMLVFAPE